MTDRENERAERRALVTAMRRRQSSHGSCCGYDPTVTDIEISPRTRRTVRIILLVGLLAAVALSIVLFAVT